MPYSFDMPKLLNCLRMQYPHETELLYPQINVVRRGMLSIGLKLHILKEEVRAFTGLINALGGFQSLYPNAYRERGASVCLVLPPVGNADAAIGLLELIEKYTHTPVLRNPYVHLQHCSPGRLSPERAALLGIMFYLTSDTLRKYTLAQFDTTVTDDIRYQRGRRMIIYDAGSVGAFDREFDWWITKDGRHRRHLLPFDNFERTDVLVGCGSHLDIVNINLIATLLVHSQFPEYSACWHDLGVSFERDVRKMLANNELAGLINAQWVNATQDPDVQADLDFMSAIQELVNSAFDDKDRLEKIRKSFFLGSKHKGIIESACIIVDSYAKAILAQSQEGEMT